MKKTIFALVAVLAFSSAAFAGQSQPGKPAAACADTHVKLDCGATGSVEETGPATHNGSTENKGPRLGIDIDPWIVPSTF